MCLKGHVERIRIAGLESKRCERRESERAQRIVVEPLSEAKRRPGMRFGPGASLGEGSPVRETRVNLGLERR